MYIDETYDMPGETLVRVEAHDLQTLEGGVALAQLLFVALNQTFQVFVDLSAVQRPSQEALIAAYEGIRRILPASEIPVRLWFYSDLCPVREYLPNARLAYQRPRTFSLDRVEVGVMNIY